jgi:hypothetical protein
MRNVLPFQRGKFVAIRSIAFALGTDIDEEAISPLDDGRSKKASSLIKIKLDGIDCR